MTHPTSSVKRPSQEHTSNPPCKRHHTSPTYIAEYNELCELLVASKVPLNPQDPHQLQQLLAYHYSPRVAYLLSNIARALDGQALLQSNSEITESSSEEGDPIIDAVVPSIVPVNHSSKPRDNPNFDAIVPQQVSHALVSKTPSLQLVVPTSAELAYNKDTEIAISRIFDLGKVKAVVNPHIHADAPYEGPSVITMSGFGELGRFGNQVMQYIFLKSFATRHAVSEIQTPGWVGTALFALKDRPVQRQFPSVVEFRGTRANSTFTDDFIDYVKGANKGKEVPEFDPDILKEGCEEGLVNVDIWGWFQWQTSSFKPFEGVIRQSFTPVDEVRTSLGDVFDKKIRFDKEGNRRTVVGVHLRLGDYQNIAASSFGYCAPTSWYLEWLEEIWPILENPVLFVASDDVGKVLKDFEKYDPLTADGIGMKMPATMKGMKAGFFPDWFGLTQCDVLGISNSTFSFSACMMNEVDGARFFRAHYKDRMVPFDPWNADPIVHRDMNKMGIAKALETLQVVYNTQGSRGLARNLLYELPYYGVRAAVMKAVLWRQANRKAAMV